MHRKIRVLDNGNLELFIAARFKKVDRRKMIIIQAKENEKGQFSDDISTDNLARHLAQAHAWLESLESGQFATVTQLSEKLNLDKSYVGKIFRLVNLAPDIQEAIISGEVPEELTLNQLRGNIPDDWKEQRQLFRMARRQP
jgi:hypothetical protein